MKSNSLLIQAGTLSATQLLLLTVSVIFSELKVLQEKTKNVNGLWAIKAKRKGQRSNMERASIENMTNLSLLSGRKPNTITIHVIFKLFIYFSIYITYVVHFRKPDQQLLNLHCSIVHWAFCLFVSLQLFF